MKRIINLALSLLTFIIKGAISYFSDRLRMAALYS